MGRPLRRGEENPNKWRYLGNGKLCGNGENLGKLCGNSAANGKLCGNEIPRETQTHGDTSAATENGKLGKCHSSGSHRKCSVHISEGIYGKKYILCNRRVNREPARSAPTFVSKRIRDKTVTKQLPPFCRPSGGNPI